MSHNFHWPDIKIKGTLYKCQTMCDTYIEVYTYMVSCSSKKIFSNIMQEKNII